MELFEVHTKILTPFTAQTIETLESMAALKGSAGKANYDDVNKFSFKGFAVAVVAKTYGSIEGKILMHYPLDTALSISKKICGNMFGEEPDVSTMNEETTEAITEFANTIIGLATRSLSKSNLKIKFSPPIYIHDKSDMEIIMDGVKEIITTPISADGAGDFYFSYLLHHVTE